MLFCFCHKEAEQLLQEYNELDEILEKHKKLLKVYRNFVWNEWKVRNNEKYHVDVLKFVFVKQARFCFKFQAYFWTVYVFS